MSAAAPLLHVIAGPNGAGKSTYYQRHIQPRFSAPFVNADLIAKARSPDSAEAHSYAAGQIAEGQRQTYLSERRSFAAETVFSHPSKLDLLKQAKAAGYVVWLTYINVMSAELTAQRVLERVERGGHRVSPDKIAERYVRVTQLMAQAVRIADKAWVLDNSRASAPHQCVMIFESGKLVFAPQALPAWAKNLLKPPPASSSRRGKTV